VSAVLATEHLLRELAPEVLAVIARRFRDFAAAEDAVQEALFAAATQWPREGMPAEPRGWLIHVAARRMTDHVRAEVARRRREALVISLIPPEDQLALAPDEENLALRDDTLSLLFMCCHPSLTPASAVALTLRAVGGLTTAEIASAFLVPEATMAQRISRAKQSIKSSGVPFSAPSPEEIEARIATVLQVLYLLFNEGYTSSSGRELVRTDLSDEAVRLTRLLRESLPHDPEVTGLLALMLLTDARREARSGPNGELIPLDAQDRSRWDRIAITEGVALIEWAMSQGRVGAYQIQAAIAALHDEASSTDTTDWAQIAALYGLLARMNDNPMVKLNHAIASAMVHGPADGLARILELESDPRLAASHRLDAVRAHLLERAGDRESAVSHYERAAARTTSAPERNYLLTQAARLREA
jgi:RNA polymerase sigma factor (sigma-70 family)